MKSKQKGFTLIELMLAMAFLASILVLCTAVIIQAFTIYNKGLAVKQINQLGRTLTEDMTRAANSGKVVLDLDTANANSHILCLGSSAYIWNTVTDVRSATIPKPVKTFETSGDEVNMVKIRSTSGEVCTSNIGVQVNRDNAIDLLSGQVRVLSASVTQVPNSNLINISFVFGTYDDDPASPVNPTEVSPGKWECAGSGLGSYCAFGVYSTTLYLPNSNNQT